ncbi:MAG: tetratricopeptide repeat protein [Candidatus Electrothrix scaldis]|nr:MAG: tetratricopeptide repeat protein [Candidatus Electrothrix sp. GW3-3]
MGSKENAVLFPGSIVLIEFFILREDVRLTKQSLLILSAGFLFILGCTLALAGPKIFLSIFDSYTGRSFTPFQRLLTQSRIVTFYLSQIFFPAPSRLSLTHDVHLSTSLFFPFTTLSSIVFLTLLVIFSFRYHKKQPLLSFAILFFLFNHTVESSFLNLEIIFEHRNYLPSLFLFLPLAALLGRSIHHYQQSNRLIFLFLSAGASLLVLLFLVGTFERNKAWLTERSLWEDSLKKAPGHSRSYVNLAHGYYQRDNNDNNKKAFELYWQSLDKYAPNPWKARLAAYGSLGYIMFRYGKYEKALKFYDQALSVAKDKPYGNLTAGILSDKANTLWIAGKKQEALNLISGLAQARPKKGVYLQQYGEMLIGMNRLAEGMIILRHVISEFPMTSTEYRKALLDFALIYARLDSMKKSSFYMRLADRLGVPVVPSSLCFIEASLLAGKKEKTGQAMQHILYKITWAELIAILEERSPNTPILPLNYPYLLQYAEEWLTEQKTP